MGRGNLKWENAPSRWACEQACGIVSWLVIDVGGPIHCGQCHTCSGGPDCCKKARKSASSFLPWLLLQFLPSGFWPAWVPALIFLSDELLGSSRWNKPFHPQVAFGHVVHQCWFINCINYKMNEMFIMEKEGKRKKYMRTRSFLLHLQT